MRTKYFIFAGFLLASALLIFWDVEKTQQERGMTFNKGQGENVAQTPLPEQRTMTETPAQLANPSGFAAPLERAKARVTKKPFGLFVTPQSSPVQPEKFRGYHTGADFEIFPEELNVDISVHAVCTGTLKTKTTASGYGGVVVQNCQLAGEPITVVYGHLQLASVSAQVGNQLTAGTMLGVLGADKSRETDGERKHLHLGFHKGTMTNIRGYVSSRNELANWLDPCLYVCNK